MNNKTPHPITSAALALMLMTLCACGGVGGELPTPTSTQEPTATATSRATPTEAPEARCGDGICDAAEKADPDVCPQDCRDQATSEEPTPESERRCGDGVCDGPENADSCPEDCVPEETPSRATPESPPASATPPPDEATPTREPASTTQLISLPDGSVAIQGSPSTVTQEGGQAGPAKQSNLAFVLDASGSMKAQLPGSGRTKLAVAKDVLSDLVSQVPEDVRGALWIYGHRYPQDPKEKSCRDIEQVFPLDPVDVGAYRQTIQGIDAIGYTPIADALQKAAEDLPPGDNQSNSIILVSDGKETCGGDPCALAAALKSSDADVTIHVVGYAVDEETREQLQCIASASGGTYSDATSADLLREALQGALELAQTDTTLRVEVVGPQEHQLSARVLLYEPGSGTLVSGMSAWRDNVVPPGTYDVWLETTPPVAYTELSMPDGSETVIRLRAGSFEFLGLEGDAVTPYQVNVNDPSSGEQLAYLLDPGDEPYYVIGGSYNLALYPSISSSAPQAVFRATIEPLKHTVLQLGAFDLRAVGGEAFRPSTIEFRDPTTDAQVARFSQSEPELYYVAPGTYDVGYGVSWTCGSWSGWLSDVQIRPGEVTVATLGAYVFHDADGEATAYAHTVTDAASGDEAGYYCGQVERYYASPGTYTLEGRYVDFTAREVVIKAGEETIVPISE